MSKSGYGKAHAPDPSSSEAAVIAEIARRIEAGLDPAEIAVRVVSAVRENQFYVFTHPEMRPELQERFEAILSAMDRSQR